MLVVLCSDQTKNGQMDDAASSRANSKEGGDEVGRDTIV
jgi:hypothetical protein